MAVLKKISIVLSGLIILISAEISIGGPPFLTDDPEPVDLKHWEFYISSINIFQQGDQSGTAPHIEMNYGIIRDVQVHVLLPLNYNHISGRNITFGYAYSEIGLKYRFMKETANRPQIGTFPIIEIPTIKNNEFGNGKTQVFLPIWIQKSWNKITTYGGAGYWINPGTGNRNWVFAGWELQYDFSEKVTLGGELYYHSSDAIGSLSATAFNLGGSINLTKKFHIIFSAGHSLLNKSFTSAYFGLLWTI